MNAILTYHSIDGSGSPISIGPEVFEAHLQWFRSGRVEMRPLDDLVGSPTRTADAVSVTFDDAFQNAVPAIERLLDAGIIPTVFAVTRHAGETNAWGGVDQKGIPTLPLMNWDDFERLARRGARIEAHTRSHPRLTRIPPSALDDELGGCRDDLKARLGIDARHVAYPYGDVNDVVAGAARRSFAFGHTTEFGPLAGAIDPLRVHRLDAYYFRRAGALEAWGSRAFHRRLGWIRARRAIRAGLGL